MHAHSTKIFKVYSKNKSFSYSSFSLPIGNHSKPVSCISSQRYSVVYKFMCMCIFFFSHIMAAYCANYSIPFPFNFFHIIVCLFLGFILPSTYKASYIYLYAVGCTSTLSLLMDI